jgi:hypothetical protein
MTPTVETSGYRISPRVVLQPGDSPTARRGSPCSTSRAGGGRPCRAWCRGRIGSRER